MSKYEPLESLLRGCAQAELSLAFDEIEQVLGFGLPDSARRHRGWWANEAKSHVQARAWMNAGWRIREVDLDEEKVRLARQRPSEKHSLEGVDLAQLVQVDLRNLSYGASRLVRDYAAEAGGNLSAAVSRGLDEAARARRARLIDLIVANAPSVPGDSTDLIREDRDAR